MHFWPEVTVIFRAASEPGLTKWLAGVSAANKVNCTNVFAFQCPHIIKARHVGPVLGQHQAAPGIDLTERHRRHAGTLQAQAEAADSAK
jgi:hypothetical protein